jgi:hypothetical protein
MGINKCCEVSMHQIDDGDIAADFVKSSERRSIGRDMAFYTCAMCNVRWCHTQEAFEPFISTWAEVL